MSQHRIGRLLTALLAAGVLFAPAVSDEEESGLVAYYMFDGDAEDASGNKNHGEVKGAAVARDRFGNPEQAYRFAGKVKEIRAPLEKPFKAEEGFTIMAWVNFGKYREEIGRFEVKAEPIEIKFSRTKSPRAAAGEFVEKRSFFVRSGLQDCFSESVLEPKTWYHHAATCDGEKLRIFVNGERVAVCDVETPLSDEKIRDLKFSGKHARADDVRIYQRALGANEILYLYEKVDKPGPAPANP